MSGPDRSGAAPASLGLALLLVACGRAQGTPAPGPALASIPPNCVPDINHTCPPGLAPASASASASALVLASAPDLPWPALVRDEEWDSAWHALEAVPDVDKARPEVRYVRARVALARGDAAGALPLLVGLEGALPLLADDVARRRAEAKLSVGPFEEAGEWFAMRVSPGPQLDAARAFEKAHDTARARGGRPRRRERAQDPR